MIRLLPGRVQHQKGCSTSSRLFPYVVLATAVTPDSIKATSEALAKCPEAGATRSPEKPFFDRLWQLANTGFGKELAVQPNGMTGQELATLRMERWKQGVEAFAADIAAFIGIDTTREPKVIQKITSNPTVKGAVDYLIGIVDEKMKSNPTSIVELIENPKEFSEIIGNPTMNYLFGIIHEKMKSSPNSFREIIKSSEGFREIIGNPAVFQDITASEVVGMKLGTIVTIFNAFLGGVVPHQTGVNGNEFFTTNFGSDSLRPDVVKLYLNSLIILQVISESLDHCHARESLRKAFDTNKQQALRMLQQLQLDNSMKCKGPPVVYQIPTSTSIKCPFLQRTMSVPRKS